MVHEAGTAIPEDFNQENLVRRNFPAELGLCKSAEEERAVTGMVAELVRMMPEDLRNSVWRLLISGYVDMSEEVRARIAPFRAKLYRSCVRFNQGANSADQQRSYDLAFPIVLQILNRLENSTHPPELDLPEEENGVLAATDETRKGIVENMNEDSTKMLEQAAALAEGADSLTDEDRAIKVYMNDRGIDYAREHVRAAGLMKSLAERMEAEGVEEVEEGMNSHALYVLVLHLLAHVPTSIRLAWVFALYSKFHKDFGKEFDKDGKRVVPPQLGADS